jgi:hypothetical protein
VRHGETSCTGPQRNGSTRSEAVARNRKKRSRSKRSEMGDPLSGPRYRGSNPCLPATNRASLPGRLRENEYPSEYDFHRGGARTAPEQDRRYIRVRTSRTASAAINAHR